MRRILVAPVLFALAACQPQQPPKTAVLAPPQGSIDLPSAAPPRYDAAITPGDDSRTPRAAAVARPVAPARPPARPPAGALTEREKQAIAQWNREEAALSYDAPPQGLRPPSKTGVTLSMPADASLPRPSSEKAALVKRSDAALPPPVERPKPVASIEPAKASVPVPPPPTAPPEPAARPEPASPEAAVAEPPSAPSAGSALPPQTAAAAPSARPRAAAPADTPIPRPVGEPAATVTFAPRSADLSDGDRLLLERFAKGTPARRVRQILLYGYAGDSDPVAARQLALARVLAVHAVLIDLGLKANIEIGDFSQASDGSADRVDVMLRN